jgi:phage-related protein
MPNPIFTLPPKWTASKPFKIPYKAVSLGDGYSVGGAIGLVASDHSWDIEIPPLNTEQLAAAISLLTQLSGVDAFDWSPDGIAANRRSYVCDEGWTVTPVSPGYARLSTKFQQFSG